MFGLLKKHRRARRGLKPLWRARVGLEELEPRSLLATSPLGNVLSSPVGGQPPNFGPALVQSAAPAPGLPTGSQPTPAGTGSSSGFNAAGASGFNQPATPFSAVPVNGGVTGQPANPVFTAPGATSPTRATFPALSTDAVLGVPGATPSGVQGGTLSPVGTAVLTFLGLAGPVATPLARPDFALLPTGPGATITTPNYYTNAPQYFDPNTHRLLFVVGGPNPRTPEDYHEGYEDGQVFPGPNQPRLSFLEEGPPPAEHVQAMSWSVATTSLATANELPSSALFFDEGTEEVEPVAVDAIGLGALGLAANEAATPVSADGFEDREGAKGAIAFLAAVAGLGLGHAPPSWQEEHRRQGLRRWRPAFTTSRVRGR